MKLEIVRDSLIWVNPNLSAFAKREASVAMGNLDPLLSCDFNGTFRIRPMILADLEEVLAVERACHTHPWSEKQLRAELENPVSSVDLGHAEEQLAGFICTWFVCGELHILDVATAPAFRRRKVASLMLNHVLARSRNMGMEKAFLEVRVSNQGAIALYETFGFHRVALRPRYYADGEDAVVMERVED
jgi:ribosomal-protein-alanine N-acetyltransferase